MRDLDQFGQGFKHELRLLISCHPPGLQGMPSSLPRRDAARVAGVWLSPICILLLPQEYCSG